MSRFTRNKCPLTLLSEQTCLTLAGQPCREVLYSQVDLYFASHKSQRRNYRDRIFFCLEPFLKKQLRRYCGASPNCYNSCIISDLLSDAFLAFSKYLAAFDESRNVDFLSYMTKRLAWYIYNNIAREQRIKMHEIRWDESSSGSLEEITPANSFEQRLLDALEVDSCLDAMTPKTRFIFLCRFYGYSYTELSELINRKEETIRKALSRACERIRETHVLRNL